MSFLYPNFLWALLALAIPIIIHLFYFRRFKRVYFTNVELLKEVKEETSTRNRLKDLLILLARLLALAALVFAFAQPFLGENKEIKKGKFAVSIYIDNSFSMSAERDEVPIIDIAKAKAREIVEAYDEVDEFQILTNDFEGRHQFLTNKENAFGWIEEINVTPTVRPFSQVYNRQLQTTTDRADHEVLYMISDFQESSADLNIEADTMRSINFLPIQSISSGNVSIDTAWLESMVPIINQNNTLIVSLTNHGNSTAENIRLTSRIEAQEKPEGAYDIPAGETIQDTLNISIRDVGWKQMVLKITDYPVQYDDTYYLSLEVPEEINVLAIHQETPNRYLRALFDGLSSYNLTHQPSASIDYGRLNEYDLIILDDLTTVSSGLASQIDNYVVAGGNVLVFPSASANIDSYNSFFNTLGVDNISSVIDEENIVSRITTDDFVFKDVYAYISRDMTLPKASKYYKFSNYASRGKQNLLTFRDGQSYLQKYVNNGHIYVSMAPLSVDYNDLVLKAEVFVPMIYKMAIAQSTGQKLSYTIGKDRVIDMEQVTQADMVYEIEGNESFIPSQRNLGNKVILSLNDEVKEAGFYDVVLNEEQKATIAFNYDRRESNLTTLTAEEIGSMAERTGAVVLDESQTNDFSKYIAEKDQGKPLWKYFVIAALIFLLIEILLIKFLK